MGRRIDYLDDPNAPKPNSLVPSVNAVVVNDAGEFLLIQRTDNGNWSLPGGAMDLGESIGDAAKRETLEETGVQCELTKIIGIYTNPGHVLEYTSNGEVRQEFSIVFEAKALKGEPTPSDESSRVEWVTADMLDDHPMHSSMRMRVDHFLDERPTPYIG